MVTGQRVPPETASPPFRKGEPVSAHPGAIFQGPFRSLARALLVSDVALPVNTAVKKRKREIGKVPRRSSKRHVTY